VTAPVVDSAPVVAAIKAAVTGVVFTDGSKPADVGSKPYIVAFFDAGTVENRSMASRDGWSMVGVFHCSGQSPDSARFAAKKLRVAILGLWGAGAGAHTFRLPEHLTGAPMSRDDDAQPALFVIVDEWRFRLS
jgi:hypothetical protein